MTLKNKIKNDFTRWYVRQGYTYYSSMSDSDQETKWCCPWWVRPLLIFFSPSVYVKERYKVTFERLSDSFRKFGNEYRETIKRLNELFEKGELKKK